MSCSEAVDIVLHSSLLGENLVLGLWPMRGPARDEEPVTYVSMEIGELARFHPSAEELRAIHRIKRLFGGMLMPPAAGETPLEVAAWAHPRTSSCSYRIPRC